ncbi:uncharacterized protein LOC127384233 [Apus apus]|uniref:uncharacterized protein LOC127384233 n=1 Tax=Apus apus TaxID=8895 RepID=UPI0021F850E2|nr:uncharacterized protein LOC127384233 [Apus apus]
MRPAGCRMAARPGGEPAVFVGRQAEGAPPLSPVVPRVPSSPPPHPTGAFSLPLPSSSSSSSSSTSSSRSHHPPSFPRAWHGGAARRQPDASRCSCLFPRLHPSSPASFCPDKALKPLSSRRLCAPTRSHHPLVASSLSQLPPPQLALVGTVVAAGDTGAMLPSPEEPSSGGRRRQAAPATSRC